MSPASDNAAEPRSYESQGIARPTDARAPELLAPAGDWDCVRAAIENGADAIYFGLQCGFNARARAANFPLTDLPRLAETLHRRGVAGYATLNTLVFSSELREFEQVVRAVAESGIDAVLVQDVGAARLVREICPDLSIHASTQMSLTSAESVRLAETLGIDRVVLARELSIDEIRRIRAATRMPLEVFVHGALCVAYSGQCLTSESFGGRSANRGQCAQACRLPYDLVQDGRDIDLGDQKYLLSPQDLAAYPLTPELIAAGVCSFKIEGRLKTPEYVANITRHYRQAIDDAMRDMPVRASATDMEEMEMSFSRGFSPGWLNGCDHKMLVPAVSSAKRGVRLGRVVSARRGRVEIALESSIKRGDGIAFEGDRAADEQQGSRVYEIFRNGRLIDGVVEGGGRVELAFRHGDVDTNRLRAGQTIWKTDDPALNARLRATFTGDHPRRRIPLRLVATAIAGERLRVVGQLQISGNTATASACDVQSAEPLPVAQKHPLTLETLHEQLGRLGGTPFELVDVQAEIVGTPMIPLSALGQIRKEMVRQLEASTAARLPRRIAPDGVVAGMLARGSSVAPSRMDESTEPNLHVLCRTLDQFHALLASGRRRLIAEFHDIRRYRDAVSAARSVGASITIATMRIQKPGELGLFLAIAKHKPDAVLVRNFAGLEFFRDRGVPVVGDFSLNVANPLTAEYYLGAGLQRWTPSYDLNREQLDELVAGVDPSRIEVVVHQHMPMFHMEHCVFCMAISPGTNKSNCGRPCDRHQVELRDRVGMEHPLHADVGCRNTLYNATPQSAAEAVAELLARGVRHFRVELLESKPAESVAIVDLYERLLSGKIGGSDVWRRLKASNRVGVTRGTLEERRNPLAIL